MDQFKAQGEAFFENNTLVANDVPDLLGKFSLATIKGEVYFVVGKSIVLVGNAKTDEYALLNLQNEALLVCKNLGNELLAELEKAFPKAKDLKYSVHKEVPPVPPSPLPVSEVQEPSVDILTPCAPPKKHTIAGAPVYIAKTEVQESPTETPAAPKKKKAVMRKRPVLSGGETATAAASESHEESVKKEKVEEKN